MRRPGLPALFTVLILLASDAHAQTCQEGTSAECVAEGTGETDARPDQAALPSVLIANCSAGDDAICSQLADDAMAGRNKLHQNRKARAALDKACERNVARACTARGAIAQGNSRRASARVRSDYELGCSLGDGRGCMRLGEQLESTDVQTAQERYQQGCLRNEPASCGRQGRLLVAIDARAALTLLQRGCDARDALSCSALGQLHEAGTVQGADPNAAEGAYRGACEGGEQDSCARLGRILIRRGENGRAEPALRSACQQKIPEACVDLGELLIAHNDPKAARGYFSTAHRINKKRCGVGDGMACLSVSEDFAKGRGRPVNPKKAQQWLARACSAGVDPVYCTPPEERKEEAVAVVAPVPVPVPAPAPAPAASTASAPLVVTVVEEAGKPQRELAGSTDRAAESEVAEASARAEASEAEARAREEAREAEERAREAAAKKAAEARAAEARRKAAEAKKREQEAQERARAAEVARAAAVAAAAAEAARVRTAQQAEAARRKKAELAVAKEKEARKRAMEREARAKAEAKAAAEREAKAKAEAKAAAEREAEARRKAEARDTKEREKARETAKREAAARKAAEKAAAKEAAARKAAEKAAAKQAAARAAAEKREQEKQRRADEMAARAAADRKRAEEREAELKRAVAEAEAKAAAARKEQEEQKKAQERAAADAKKANAEREEREARANSLEELRLKCDAGDADSCEKAANDKDSARRLYERSCMKGTGATACERAIEALRDTDGKEAKPRIARLARKGCAAKSRELCVIAGDSAVQGSGASLDLHQAIEDYAVACDSGEGPGCEGLENLCARGMLRACEQLDGGENSTGRDSNIPVFVRAASLRQRGRDRDAAVLLAEELRVRESPRLHAELGLAYQGTGSFVRAEHHLDNALTETDDPWISAHRKGLERVRDSARKNLGWLVIECNPSGVEGFFRRSRIRCARPVRIAVGKHTVELRAPGHRSKLAQIQVSQGEHARLSPDLSTHTCSQKGMMHMAGDSGGCCWPGQNWVGGTCQGAVDPLMVSAATAAYDDHPSAELETFHFSLLGGATNFVGKSLFRSGVDPNASSTSLGPRAELRVGLGLGERFTLEGIAATSRAGITHWRDCDGASSCMDTFPHATTTDYGLMLQFHTKLRPVGADGDTHLGVGVRPWTRIRLEGSDGPARLKATVVPAEFGVSFHLAPWISIELLGQAELWLPQKYCTDQCVDAWGNTQKELSWSALTGLSFHVH